MVQTFNTKNYTSYQDDANLVNTGLSAYAAHPDTTPLPRVQSRHQDFSGWQRIILKDHNKKVALPSACRAH